MTEKYDLREVLQHVDPSALNYQEWLSVGMALKESGYTALDWEQWSQQDADRYHTGECFRKWGGFAGSTNPVAGGTIVHLAREQGWDPEPDDSPGHELDWGSIIGARDDLVVVDRSWLESRDLEEPADDWNPVDQLVTYLETLFEASENVGYVTESWYDQEKEKYLPTKGCWDRTAGELIQRLKQCDSDIGKVLGDYKPEVGAWIRFNPLDGQGAKNENVTDYRYALVESDNMEIGQQNALIRELELPVACLVHSGRKSLHAIVRIEAADYNEYRKRVDYLYTVLKNNGMSVDTQNKNPSRLSRMPGVMRDGRKQYLVDTNIGKESWKEWQEYVESINDDLPDPESMADAWDNLPELSPPLIDGVLRQGHKMLLAGPSKAGKSYALIELCIAIAEGKPWLRWQCTQGRVLYVNLELDRASCLHRFVDVYNALCFKPENLRNIDIWNLRGKSVPMDQLAPKLIRRAIKKRYIAVVIDPIYKVITGDENSADQMAHFCNQFDRVCSELGAAVIYCHHHSKGLQGQKRSMDRASGSGVFARDPDALLDLIELDLTDGIRKQEENKAVCLLCCEWLSQYVNGWNDQVSQDDRCNERDMLDACRRLLANDIFRRLQDQIVTLRAMVNRRTAWRIDGTLREFEKFQPVDLWFDYPIHRIDCADVLKDVDAESDGGPTWQKNFRKKRTPEQAKSDRKESIETAYEGCKVDGKVTLQGMAEYLGVSDKTVRNRIKEHGGYWIDGGVIGKKE